MTIIKRIAVYYAKSIFPVLEAIIRYSYYYVYGCVLQLSTKKKYEMYFDDHI